ncbi:periplasmic flagellar collar protein FlcA [Spirochaeta dissipatitropha]
MPRIEDLQDFQKKLVSIAREGELLAQQGKIPELADPPDNQIDADQFSDLFDDDPGSMEPEIQEDYTQQLFESVQAEDEDSGAAEDSSHDFADLLAPDDDDPFSDIDEFDIPQDLFAGEDEDDDVADGDAADIAAAEEAVPSADEPEEAELEEAELEEDFLNQDSLDDVFSDGDMPDEAVSDDSVFDDSSLDEVGSIPDDFDLPSDSDFTDANDEADDDADDDLGDFDLESFSSIEDVPDLDQEPDIEFSRPEDNEAGTTGDLDSIDDIGSFDELDSIDELGPVDDLDALSDFGAMDFGDTLDADVSGKGASESNDLDGIDDLSGIDDLDGIPGLDDMEAELGDFDVDMGSDEFSLGDFGAEFGVLEEEQGDVGHVDHEHDFGDDDAELLEASPEDSLQLSESEFAELRKNLQNLPLNVKMHVEEIIAEAQGSPRQQKALLDLVIAGENARIIAGNAGRIIGRKIEVPKGYEKHSGIEFEEQKDSFSYQFKHVIWPVVRSAIIILALLSTLVLSVYRFVFSPLYAGSLYRQGHSELVEENYSEGERLFARAREYHDSRRWFLRYADEYRTQREFLRARSKFEETLLRWPGNRAALLAYGGMESEDLLNYARAEELLSSYYRAESSRVYDYDIQLARGDNFLRWGEQDFDRYEDARRTYAGLLEQEGVKDLLLFRMLRYFVRTDNFEEVRLLHSFIEAGGAAIDADAWTELGGYYLDKHEQNPLQHSLEGISQVLLAALDADSSKPAVYYHLARNFRHSGDRAAENRALETGIGLFDAKRPLGRLDVEMLIDSLIRRGENHSARDQDVDALRYLSRARNEYESAVSRLLVQPDERFGRLYSRMGDIYYYRGSEYAQALELYRRAEANGYSTREQDYRTGVIHYRSQRYDQALDAFADARGSFSDQRNLEYALGNTLYRRGSYSAAAAHYQRLLRDLQNERRNIENLFVDENPQHYALIEYLRRVSNNLGAAMLRESGMTGERERWNRGMAHLTESAELSEDFFRNPETAERAEIVNLGYLNLRSAMSPAASFDLEIFDGLLQDFSDIRFRTY